MKYFILATAISFLACSCLTNKNINTSLDGVWDRGDIVISITGSNGVFTRINPDTNWDRVLKNDSIKIGDINIRNITQTDNMKWTAQALKYNERSFVVNGWTDVSITMTEDGQTLIVTADDVANPKNTFTRIE